MTERTPRRCFRHRERVPSARHGDLFGRVPGLWTFAFALALALILPAALPAQEGVWRAVPPSSGWSTPAPAVSLGEPVPVSAAPSRPQRQTSLRIAEGTWTRAPDAGREAETRPTGQEGVPGGPAFSRVVRAQGPVDPPPPGAAPPVVPNVPYDPGLDVNRPLQTPFWDRPFLKGCREFFSFGVDDHFSSTGRWTFMSDPAFCGLSSPVTNPFFFEDPRALTELRPILMYQSAPSGNPIFAGGHAEFLGVQGRLALTERWSVMITKLGFVALAPNQPQADPTGEFSDSTGFAEVDFGAKYTFLRNPDYGMVAAAGLHFQVPAGGGSVFQDTGSLSLDPYVTFAKSFGQLGGGWGNLNFIGELGYSFSIDNARSDFIHGSMHLDYDIAGLHRFFPLFEVNWFHYTGTGDTRSVGFEGADLVNFGSRTLDGTDYVYLGPGFRYRFRDWWEAGVAAEWAVTNARGIEDFRVTLDCIFRY
jgi:hypothetical protein